MHVQSAISSIVWQLSAAICSAAGGDMYAPFDEIMINYKSRTRRLIPLETLGASPGKEAQPTGGSYEGSAHLLKWEEMTVGPNNNKMATFNDLRMSSLTQPLHVALHIEEMPAFFGEDDTRRESRLPTRQMQQLRHSLLQPALQQRHTSTFPAKDKRQKIDQTRQVLHQSRPFPLFCTKQGSSFTSSLLADQRSANLQVNGSSAWMLALPLCIVGAEGLLMTIILDYRGFQ
eukprot:SM000155S01683  [mRNA]  locus=s155:313443:320552:- [translate_table: standard]